MTIFLMVILSTAMYFPICDFKPFSKAHIIVGFPRILARILGRGGLQVMPPFIRQKRQLDSAQRKECRKIAKDRVHVERAFERLRRFKVMQFATHHMYRHFNKLVIILAYTVNQFGPLIRDPNCMYKPEEHVENEDDIREEDYLNSLLDQYIGIVESGDENNSDEDNNSYESNDSDVDISFSDIEW